MKHAGVGHASHKERGRMKQYTYELDTEFGYSTDACSRVLRIILNATTKRIPQETSEGSSLAPKPPIKNLKLTYAS